MEAISEGCVDKEFEDRLGDHSQFVEMQKSRVWGDFWQGQPVHMCTTANAQCYKIVLYEKLGLAVEKKGPALLQSVNNDIPPLLCFTLQESWPSCRTCTNGKVLEQRLYCMDRVQGSFWSVTTIEKDAIRRRFESENSNIVATNEATRLPDKIAYVTALDG